ncbi:DUF6163 family protein [Bartonella tamiae]|uniref:DUF2069 domain-containing protein n=1 Tax=Bartonella tamiae Th239 TaxID=1094558 RepID=J1JWA0_9HYPH|nr:DUF6163 family protein [Bartonella tamiae]EJF88860.1 hypothetical protein ME5_01411 [Bartonella tamiae Th239]EJF94890.1 hypothetical protein MEG_00471 [Bartonella tamiae Th307]
MDNQLRQIDKIDLLSLSFGLYLRFLALICLIFGCMYWTRLIGLFPGELWRIDTMPMQWQTLCGALAVIYPVAAIGLWLRSPWGVILWIFAAFCESLVFTVYQSSFIYMPSIAFLQGILFLGFLAFQVAIFYKKRQKDIINTEY